MTLDESHTRLPVSGRAVAPISRVAASHSQIKKKKKKKQSTAGPGFMTSEQVLSLP